MRKLQKLEERVTELERHRASQLQFKVPEGTDPVQWLFKTCGWNAFGYEAQILHDHAVRLRVVKKARQIGITTTISGEATWKAATSFNRLILIISPSFRQSKVPMDKIHALIDTTPTLYDHVVQRSRSEITFDNGSKILSLPNNPDRLRAYSPNDIYMDEAAHFLNDEPVMRAIRPMLIATRGTLTIVSTPFGKRGLFWDRWQYAVQQQAADPDNVRAYDLCPSTISPLITEADMEAERELLTELEFRQEYLGEFLEEVDVYIPIDLISACVDPELEPILVPQPTRRFYYGIDFAKRRHETAVIILEKIKLPDGVYYQLVTRQWWTWAGMDYTDQIGRLGQLRKHLPCAAGKADQSGVGEPVIEMLRNVQPNIEGVIFSAPLKVSLLGRLRAVMESTRLMKQDGQPRTSLVLPNDKKLITQTNMIRYEVSRAGNILFQDDERTHVDYPWALALAVDAASASELVVQSLYTEPPSAPPTTRKYSLSEPPERSQSH